MGIFVLFDRRVCCLKNYFYYLAKKNQSLKKRGWWWCVCVYVLSIKKKINSLPWEGTKKLKKNKKKVKQNKKKIEGFAPLCDFNFFGAAGGTRGEIYTTTFLIERKKKKPEYKTKKKVHSSPFGSPTTPVSVNSSNTRCCRLGSVTTTARGIYKIKKNNIHHHAGSSPSCRLKHAQHRAQWHQ